MDIHYSYLLIAISLVLLKPQIKNIKNFPGYRYLFIFLLALIISAFLSLNPYKSFQELPKFLSYFLVFCVVYYGSAQENKNIMITLILSAVAASLYAIYWFYFGSLNLLEYMQEQQIHYPFALELLSRKRAFMPFVLPSILAGYLIMALPVSIGYFLEAKKRWPGFNVQNSLMALVILSIAYALFLTKSIGAFLSLFLASSLFLCHFRFTNKRTYLLLPLFLGLLVLIYILRINNSLYFTTPVFSIYRRLSYWQDALFIIVKHPLQGVGIGNFPFLQSRYVHNSYLQIWAETGILGIIGFLGFLFVSLKELRPKRLTTDKIYAGYIIAYFGFLIHNFIDFSFFIPEVCVFWWTITAFCLYSGKAT